MHRRQVLLGLTIGLVLFMVGGCALFSLKPPEVVLEERVMMYMQARVDEQWGSVYEFFDSDFREKTTRDQFLGMSAAMDFVRFRIEHLEIDPNGVEAEVKLKVDVSVRGFEFEDTPELQHWVKEGRTWYIKIKQEKSTPFD